MGWCVRWKPYRELDDPYSTPWIKSKEVNSLLKSLSEEYARRAREFSDAVALLGRHDSVGPEFMRLFKKIKRQRELCGDAEEKLEQYIQQEIGDPEGTGSA
jgi:hypothetical protein